MKNLPFGPLGKDFCRQAAVHRQGIKLETGYMISAPAINMDHERESRALLTAGGRRVRKVGGNPVQDGGVDEGGDLSGLIR